LKWFKHHNQLPIIEGMNRYRQQGAALIASIFVMTALLAIGGLMTQLMVLGSEETINEWYSAQALYAAESGAEWSIYNGGASAANQVVIVGSAWFTVGVVVTPYTGGNLFTINSVGAAGGTAANARTQRTLSVQYR